MQARATANVAREIFLIATEESGDRLGSGLMKVLRQRLGGAVQFEGVGGQSMAREGLASLFPIEELSIMGLAAVVKQLPKILRLIRETATAVTEASPDILLGLLPFEPEAYHRLRGPPCSYVGHPLIEQIGQLRPGAGEQMRRDIQPPVLLVLPGSRRSEINHHAAVFGETLGLLHAQDVAFELVLPTLPHLQDAVAQAVKSWPVQPRVVAGDKEKRAVFRIAHAAFVKSGTATLELAIAGVPMVAAYKVGAVEAAIMRRAIRTSSVILANLVIGENVVPEFIQEDCAPDKLLPALRDILTDSLMRRRQLEAFAKLDAIMSTGKQPPSVRAADIVLATLRKARGSG